MSLLPFRWHPIESLVILGALVVQVRMTRDGHRRRLAAFALLSLFVVTAWPIGDLAASVSLTVATVQRLVIMLFVAPLWLLSLSTSALVRLSRPAAVDALVRRLTHPGLAMLTVTVLGTFSLMTPAVDWGARSTLGRDVVVLVVLALGIVLWMPALAIMPGTRHLSPIARAGYIFAAALVVTSLSFVWIFANHPLYPGLHHQRELLHMSALLDQQIAGFVAKLGAYIPMWAVSFAIFSRAEDRGVDVEQTPLHWADVEREMLRADRRRAHEARRRGSRTP
jgi:cytochrome c oxidase assembly factor CtaG